MAPQKIIIDTDPGTVLSLHSSMTQNEVSMLTWNIQGVDDTLAMLLALSAKPEELDVVMLSVTYGNVPLQR